jgi:hypothetical protein
LPLTPGCYHRNALCAMASLLTLTARALEAPPPGVVQVVFNPCLVQVNAIRQRHLLYLLREELAFLDSPFAVKITLFLRV